MKINVHVLLVLLFFTFLQVGLDTIYQRQVEIYFILIILSS